MSMDKAIASGKEYRKPYRGAKAVDKSCRNHGSCDWCRGNRLYQAHKEVARMKDMVTKINSIAAEID